MKKRNKLVAALLCCCMALAAIGCGASEEKPVQSDKAGEQQSETNKEEETTPSEPEVVEVDPFGGYDEPITLTTITHQTVTQAVAEGITLEDNPWQDLWKSKGINVEYSAIATDAADVASQINLAITSGEIPDYMDVSYATYKELLEADMLMDLTDVIEQYATGEVKERMYLDGGVMAQNVTVDGRAYGIAQPVNYFDKGGVVAIRTDWLEELGLEAPDSMEELWSVAKAFKDNNMDGTCTIGIGATKDLGDMLAMKYLINAHGGHISAWLEKDGELVNGIIQPETKQALAELREKYEEGLLDQEYGTKTEAQLFEDAVAGKSGIVVCNMTGPFYVENGISLGQEWGYIPLYGEEGKFAPMEVGVNIGSCLVVSKECEHPEAVIKLLNMFVKYSTEANEEFGQNGVNNLSYPAIISLANGNQVTHNAYLTYIETGEIPAEATTAKGTIETCEKWRVDNNVEGRILYNVFGPGSTQAILKQELEGGGYLMSAFTGAPGEASVKYGGNLGSLSDQMITNIITGAKDVDYFDEFVELWKSNGGDELTKEVNEWYQDMQ